MVASLGRWLCKLYFDLIFHQVDHYIIRCRHRSLFFVLSQVQLKWLQKMTVMTEITNQEDVTVMMLLCHIRFLAHTHTRAGGSPSVGSAEVLKKNVVESQSDYNLQP